jgi:hypothetical protein
MCAGPLSKLFFIIDFGLARKFQEESGQHCKQVKAHIKRQLDV